jgi:hypothetical protein
MLPEYIKGLIYQDEAEPDRITVLLDGRMGSARLLRALAQAFAHLHYQDFNYQPLGGGIRVAILDFTEEPGPNELRARQFAETLLQELHAA